MGKKRKASFFRCRRRFSRPTWRRARPVRKPRTGIDTSWRHRACIGGGGWASCARGVCVPPTLVGRWKDQGFSEDYIARLTDDYLKTVPEGEALPSDGFRLWGGVWDTMHNVHVPAQSTGKDTLGVHVMKTVLGARAARGEAIRPEPDAHARLLAAAFTGPQEPRR